MPHSTRFATPHKSVSVSSFGYNHGPAPRADLTLDVRRWLRDPAAARDIVELDGRDPRVQEVVRRTPGAVDAVDQAVNFVDRFPAGHDCAIAIGCAGGRHRSAALAVELADRLAAAGHTVNVQHRDIHRPIVTRTPDPDCVFCAIVAGTSPAVVVRRWAHAIAIVPLGPVATGHLLVIPTTHVPHVAADPAISAATMAAAAELAGMYEHCNLITSRGEHATQTIDHLHLHLCPRNAGDRLPLPWTPQVAAA